MIAEYPMGGLGVSDVIPPVHCSDDMDCSEYIPERIWLRCTKVGHERIARARSRCITWLSELDLALRARWIGAFELPHPTAGKPSFVEVLDTDNVVVMIANAHQSRFAEHSIYVGLVMEDFTGQWRGIAGIFIPGCVKCDPWAVQAAALVRQHLVGNAGLAWTAVEPTRLPAGLRPQRLDVDDDWFQGRLRDVAAPRGFSAGTRWRSMTNQASAGSWLLRTGIVTQDLTSLLVIDTPEALSLVADLTASPVSAITGRPLSEERVKALRPVAFQPTLMPPITIANNRQLWRCPSRWGVLTSHHDNEMTVHMVRNVQQAAREQLNLNADYVRAFPAGSGVAVWTQMKELVEELRGTVGL